jgi:Zn-dependent oligopeptidase
LFDLSAAETKSVDDFRAAAAKANAVLTIPEWEQTPEAIEASIKDAIAKANTALDQIGAQDLAKVTFKSTVVALDDLTYEASNAANKATIIKETNTNAAMRTAAENAVKAFQDWVVGIDYREDVYKAIKAFADTHPKLSGEDEKLLKKRCAIIGAPGWGCRLTSARRSSNSAKSCRSWERISTPTLLVRAPRSFSQKPT